MLWSPLDREHLRKRRRYAQCIPPKLRFEFAEATLGLDAAHRRGVVAHEVGHVVEYLMRGNTSERGADRTAKQTLGVEIGYDKSWPGKGLQVARGTTDLLSPFPFDKRVVFANRELPGGVERQVPLSKLRGTQRLLSKMKLDRCRAVRKKLSAALVYETRVGTLYIADGHHRLAIDVFQGVKIATVRVLSVEPIGSKVGRLTR